MSSKFGVQVPSSELQVWMLGQQVSRVMSVDVLRGLVMVLMAIDHVRVYSGVPAGGPTAGHLLHALGDAFLRAGVRVSRRDRLPSSTARSWRDTRALSRYLLTRGLILVLLELTVIRLTWTFSLALDDVPARGRHLDARLVHGADVGARAAAVAGDCRHSA